MYFLLNLSHRVKRYGPLCQILDRFTITIRYGKVR